MVPRGPDSAVTPRRSDDRAMAYARGWPVTLTESSLLDSPGRLRPLLTRDASAWRATRVRNAEWLRPWEPTNPETPLYQSNLGPYIAMVRTMRKEARHGVTLPWAMLYGGKFAGQLTVGNIIWGFGQDGFRRLLGRPAIRRPRRHPYGARAGA